MANGSCIENLQKLVVMQLNIIKHVSTKYSRLYTKHI